MDKLAQIIIDDAKSSIKGVDFSQLKNKNVLITGASGLVGTYLLAGLLKTGVKVYAVCQSKPEKYWEEISKGANATVIGGDLCDDDFVNKLPKADIIIHAGGYGQPGKFMENPLKTIKMNTAVTLKLFDKLNNSGKFLFMSTSEVYSGLSKPPFKETEIGTTNTDHPRSCYIEAKRCGEAIVSTLRSSGVDAKSVRLSLAYGPGTKKDDKRVLNSFIGRALTEKKINMMDDGSALRTYCYITDAVWMMWKILLEGKDNIYNVGGISRTTIADLAKLIGKNLKVPVNIPKSEKQALVGAPEDVSLNLDKVKNEFGKKDFVSLEVGVKKTIEWQKVLYK
ncbi:MAG: NAD-dependent epimerase/dehydratase family protein [Minisyncoccia bacterium]